MTDKHCIAGAFVGMSDEFIRSGKCEWPACGCKVNATNGGRVKNELIELVKDIGLSQFQGEIEYEWCSTPALWAAMRPGYDGAPDSNCKVGYGKTKEQAAADLIEQEDV